MIGGADVIIENHDPFPGAALDLIVRCIFRRWPDAIAQDGMEGRRFLSYADIAFGCVSELLVYRDDLAFESWTRLGADPSNANTMIHLIMRESIVTVVVDAPGDPLMASMLSETRDLLSPLTSYGMAA